MTTKKFILFASFTFLATYLFFVTEAKAVDKIDTKVTTGASVQYINSDKKLTVMVYCDADNDLEENLLEDIKEIKAGYIDNPNLNVVVLVDRTPEYSDDSTILGEDFSDTRMYKIEKHKAVRIAGGSKFPEITKDSNYEANMGDAHTLKKFIDSCKENYPADKYVLIMSDHGGGARTDKSLNKHKTPKSICWDDSNDEDCLYTAEISDVLTNDESVDVLAYDACLMGTAEVAYQYRPGNGGFQANVMVASAPNVWGKGFDYKKIFSRLKSGRGNNGKVDLTLGGKELFFNPSTVTDFQLGAIMVEAQRDSAESSKANDQVLSCFDLTKAESVKKSIDEMSRALWNENKKVDMENLRGADKNVTLIHYFSESSDRDWLEYPYFDLYDLCKNISTSSTFSDNIKTLAKNIMNNVDDMIVYSYGGSRFKGFTEGKNGLSIFFPNGSKIYKYVVTNTSYSAWKSQRWYNSIDTTTLQPDYLYGKLSWCKDGQTEEINDVGNWFELLDCWFDTKNDETGGDNGYQW